MKTHIQTPTNQLQNSLEFYRKLNFTQISSESPTLFSDGKVIIEINADRFARAGIKLWNDSWKEQQASLEKITEIHQLPNGYLLSDPCGIWIYLVESQESNPEDLSGISPSILGNFAGISLETTQMQKSMEIWQILGFNITMGSASQGWVALKNENEMGVSLMRPLMCPHLFFNPSFTYFNGKENLAVIEKIRNLQIPITEEITHFNQEGIVDNVILRDPGGFGFFVFND